MKAYGALGKIHAYGHKESNHGNQTEATSLLNIEKVNKNLILWKLNMTVMPDHER